MRSGYTVDGQPAHPVATGGFVRALGHLGLAAPWVVHPTVWLPGR